MTLFERVKEISKKHGFSSLRVLSEQAGLSPNVIYGWKTKEPSAKTLQAVADVLGVSVDYLLGNTDEMHSNKNDAMPSDLEEVLRQVNPVMFGGAELTDEQKILLYNMAKEMSRNNQQGGK